VENAPAAVYEPRNPRPLPPSRLFRLRGSGRFCCRQLSPGTARILPRSRPLFSRPPPLRPPRRRRYLRGSRFFTFTPLDALAALTAFIPEKGLQLARYYGFYSNKARGQRRRQDAPALNPMAASCPDAPQDDDFRRFCRRAWARLIRKVYLADPLTCPKCGGRLRILSFIDNPCDTSNSGFFPSARPRPGVQQHWNLTPIFLPGRPRNDYLTPSTDPAARRGGSRRQSKPGLKGMLRPAEIEGSSPLTFWKLVLLILNVRQNSGIFALHPMLFCSCLGKAKYYQPGARPEQSTSE